jgi:hypothetical protein
LPIQIKQGMGKFSQTSKEENFDLLSTSQKEVQTNFRREFTGQRTERRNESVGYGR